MSEPPAAAPAPEPGSAHRQRPRRRAARPAGPPPSVDTAAPASAPAPAAPEATAATAPPRTRTKARHGARGERKDARSAPAPAIEAPATQSAQSAQSGKTQPARTQNPRTGNSRTQPARNPSAKGQTARSAATTSAPPAARRGRPSFGGPDGGDAAWKDLAGGGPSKVGLSGALRARDVDRPTAEDMAEAERSVVIVRRDAAGSNAPVDGQSSASVGSAKQGRQNAAATGDAPTRRGRRQRPSGAGV